MFREGKNYRKRSRIGTDQAAEEMYGKFSQSENPQGGKASPTCSSFESSTVSSRCSVRIIHELVTRLSKEQADLVRSIGFDGLLHMPMLKQINLRFSAWLMSRVDVLSQKLMISDDISIQFHKTDVAKVFGIPESGKSILCNSGSMSFMQTEANIAGDRVNIDLLRTVKGAQSIVSRCYVGPMSSGQQDEFKAAFVVVVMSLLLAPSAKHDRVSDEYMHAILYPRQISSFDWAEYVLRRLLDAVAKLKVDLANNVKSPCIYGCSLFLQVLYLDSIDMGLLSMPHNVFPRISCFSAERLRSMIVVVTSMSANGADLSETRITKLRHSSGICYHWASSQPPTASLPNHTGMLHLWDAVLLMTRVLKIPLEAAGPLFVAAADFQIRNSASMAIEALCVLLHIMEPYVNGFSYQSSFTGQCHFTHPHTCSRSECSLHLTCTRFKMPSSTLCNQKASSSQLESICKKRTYSSASDGLKLHGADHRFSIDAAPSSFRGCDVGFPTFPNSHHIDMMALIAMARFYLNLRPVRATRCCDLNQPPDLVGCSSNTTAPLSPWQLGHVVNIDVVAAASARRNLSFVQDTDEPWIVHNCPKYIEVLTSSLKSQIAGQSEFEMELFDAVIRRYKQIDDALYSTTSTTRWRHYVESDFMVSLIAGWFNISDPVVRSHFYSRHIGYDVSSCEMIFFPVLLQYRWVCFAWRMKDNTIVVYDPCFLLKASRLSSTNYESVVSLLKNAMSLVASSYFDGWDNDWGEPSIEIFHPEVLCNPRINQSGLLCLYFCKCFDGKRLAPPLAEGLLEEWACTVLRDVSSLSGNLGVVPPAFRMLDP